MPCPLPGKGLQCPHSSPTHCQPAGPLPPSLAPGAVPAAPCLYVCLWPLVTHRATRSAGWSSGQGVLGVWWDMRGQVRNTGRGLGRARALVRVGRQGLPLPAHLLVTNPRLMSAGRWLGSHPHPAILQALMSCRCPSSAPSLWPGTAVCAAAWPGPAVLPSHRRPKGSGPCVGPLPALQGLPQDLRGRYVALLFFVGQILMGQWVMALPFDFVLISGPWNHPQGHALAGSDWELGSLFGPVFTVMTSASAVGCDPLHTRLFPKNGVSSWGIWDGGPLKTRNSDKMGRPRLPVSAGEPLAPAVPCALLAAVCSAFPARLQVCTAGLSAGGSVSRLAASRGRSCFRAWFRLPDCGELRQKPCRGLRAAAPSPVTPGRGLVLQAELPEFAIGRGPGRAGTLRWRLGGGRSWPSQGLAGRACCCLL